MNFDLTPDQTAVLSGIEPILQDFRRLPDAAQAHYYVYGDRLDQKLTEAGYFGAKGLEGLGLEETGLLVEKLSELPFCVEAMTSLIIAPALGLSDLTRPLALLRRSAPRMPGRFLPMAGSALIEFGDRVGLLDMKGVDVEAVDTMFAFPYGRISGEFMDRANPLNISVEQFRHLWRIGVACEIVGAMKAALDLTVDFVKQRHQFGRALGTFQAIQHRLSQCAVLVEGAQTLTYRALWSNDEADAALAAAYSQDACSQLIYDTHQFHGAMGLTLEYPLHYWTFRLKALQGELGGGRAQAVHGAEKLWRVQA